MIWPKPAADLPLPSIVGTSLNLDGVGRSAAIRP
jgi:hypothetical protein